MRIINGTEWIFIVRTHLPYFIHPPNYIKASGIVNIVSCKFRLVVRIDYQHCNISAVATIRLV